MKSEKGMTLVTTAILVVVITALVFAIVYYARMQYAKERLEDIKTDLLLVQAKVKTIQENYTLEKEKEDVLKGTKLADMQDDKKIEQFLEQENIDVSEKNKKYYVLNKEDLEELDLKKVELDENSYYIVEYTTNEVYYTKGFTYSDGNTYYTLTEIENLEINSNE